MFCRLLIIFLLLPLLLTTCLHAQEPPLYQNDFEGPALPAGWLPLAGQWSIAADETNCLQQSQPSFRGQARIVMQESNYQVEATCRALNVSGQWGVGLVGYWQASGDCYRLSNFGNMLVLWRETHGTAEALAAVKMDFKPQGYRMRLALSNQGPVTVLRGKVWALGEAEPEEYTITGEDGAEPLRYGRGGLFTGRASAIFTEFALTRLSAAPSASATPTEVEPPPATGHWQLVGGDWQLQRDNLRQNAPGSTLGFHASAYAIAAGWRDYTVQVNAKAATGSHNQGFGLTAYWLDDGNHYEFGQMGDKSLALIRRTDGNDPVFLATVPLTVKKGLWYVLKLQLCDTPQGTVLRGKAWPAHAGEPMKWQIEAEDVARPALTGGDVGLWALDDVCSFDEIRVTANQ
ncbi:MAG: hypothetical protein ACM3VW_08320 [Bacteroidota bacterium]